MLVTKYIKAYNSGSSIVIDIMICEVVNSFYLQNLKYSPSTIKKSFRSEKI